MSNSSRKKDIRESRIEAGVCVQCGQLPAQSTNQRCPDCQKIHNATSRKMKAKRATEERCIRCGKDRYQSYRICQECRTKELYTKRWKHAEQGTCLTCGKNQAKEGKRNCQPCLDRLYRNGIKRKDRNRQLVLDHYGRKCSCPNCPTTHEEFLTVDHIDGNGAAHRKEIGRGAHVYSWLVKNNFPEGFRILCFNCNCVRNTYGYCPHEMVCANEKDKQRLKRRLELRQVDYSKKLT